MAAVCDYIDDDNQGSGASCGRTPEQFVEIIYTEPVYVENAATGALENVGDNTAYVNVYLCDKHSKGDAGLFHVENPGDGWELSQYLEFINSEYGDELLSVTVYDMYASSDRALFL